MSQELEAETTLSRQERREDKRVKRMAKYVMRKVNSGQMEDIPAKSRRVVPEWRAITPLDKPVLTKLNRALSEHDIIVEEEDHQWRGPKDNYARLGARKLSESVDEKDTAAPVMRDPYYYDSNGFEKRLLNAKAQDEQRRQQSLDTYIAGQREALEQVHQEDAGIRAELDVQHAADFEEFSKRMTSRSPKLPEQPGA